MFKPLIERLSASRTGFGAVSSPRAAMQSPALANIQITDAPAGIVEPSEPESMLSLVLSRLAALQTENPATREQLESLKADIGPLLMQADELEQAILAEQKQSLESEHRQIRKAGRKQLELVARLEQEWKNREVVLQNAINEQRAILDQAHALADMEREGRHLSRWANDEEIAAWRKRVKRVKARINPANEAIAEALQARNQKEAEWDHEQKELARLAAEEMRLRKRLAGEAYTDPEYGLEVPA